MKTPFLVGSRLYARPLERDDAPTVQAWFNDPDVRATTLGYRPLTLRDEQDFIENIGRDPTGFIVLLVVREGDRPIGVTGLRGINERNRGAEFGITLGEKSVWGQGYGSEATRLIIDYVFNTRNLHRLWLRVFEYNIRAIRCYERAGFVREGTLRQEHYHDGRYWDTHVMSILRPEWDQRRATP